MGVAGNGSNPYSSHVVERDGRSSNTKCSDFTAAEMQVNPISGDLSLINVKLEHSWSSVQAFVVEHMPLKDLDLDWSKEVVGLNGFRYVGCNDLRDIALSSLHMFFKTTVEMLSCEGYTEVAVLNAILDSALCHQFDGPITKIAEHARTLLQSSNQADYSRSENADTDLHMLGLYILCKASSLLKTYYPFFTWGDALWCILLCDMDISIAREVSVHMSAYGNRQSEGLSLGHSDLCEDHHNANELSEGYGCSSRESPAQFEPAQSEAVQRMWSNILTNYIVSVQRTATKNEDAPSGQDGNSFMPATVVQHNKKLTKASRRKKNSNSMKSQKDASKELVMVKNAPQCKGIGKTCSRILKESKSLMALFESAQSTLTPSEVATEKGLQTSTSVPTEPLSGLFSVEQNSTSVVAAGLHSASCYFSYPSSAEPKQQMDSDVVCFFLPDTPAEGFEFSFSRDGLQTTWVPKDRKDELALDLIQRLGELKLEVKVWTDWANERVMQSTSRLVNERAVLLSYRKDNTELEEPDVFNIKKLEETQKAIDSTSEELDRVNSHVRELTDKISLCRHEKKAAQLQGKQSDASLADIINKENDSMERLKSMETEKILLQEELAAERSKLPKLLKSLDKVRGYENMLKKRCQEGEKIIDELTKQICRERTELERIDTSARTMSNNLLLRARNEQEWLQASIKNLQQQIDEISGKAVSQLISPPGEVDSVQREQECAMCLEEEISVVFLPCGHQIVCAGCNQRHLDGGMTECPSCRSIIHRRICARFSDN